MDQNIRKRLYRKYGRKNKTPKGFYNLCIPDGCAFKKWDIVENIGNTITKGTRYIVIGYLEYADIFGVGLRNQDGSMDGYILVRISWDGEAVETVLPKDYLSHTGATIEDTVELTTILSI